MDPLVVLAPGTGGVRRAGQLGGKYASADAGRSRGNVWLMSKKLLEGVGDGGGGSGDDLYGWRGHTGQQGRGRKGGKRGMFGVGGCLNLRERGNRLERCRGHGVKIGWSVVRMGESGGRDSGMVSEVYVGRKPGNSTPGSSYTPT